MREKMNDNLLTYSNLALNLKDDFYHSFFNKSKKTEEKSPKIILKSNIGKNHLTTDSNTFTNKIYNMFYKYKHSNFQNNYSQPKFSFKNSSYNRSNSREICSLNSSKLTPSTFSPLSKNISMYRNTINTDKYYLTKEKPFNLKGFQKKLKRFNEFYLTSKKNNEQETAKKQKTKSCDFENQKNSKILNEQNIMFFNNEYNKFRKKKIEKQIIINEINDIGKKMSWIKDNTNKKQYSIANELLYKKLVKKNPILEINQTSSLPAIMQDKNLTANCWRADMSKYSQFILNLKKIDDQIFYKDLLGVYDSKNE